MSDTEILLAMTTLPDAAQAQALAQKLIELKLAACIQCLAPCVSVYEWEGQVEHSSEVPLLIKTTRAAWPALEQAIRTAHPYELPEIIAVPVAAGLPAYLDWVARQTHPSC
jgi:periplasmic divalent cation tolerance protein